MTQIRFLAVDGDGTFFLYDDIPTWNENLKQWEGMNPRCIGGAELDDYDDIPYCYQDMTYKDTPVMVELFSEVRVFKKYH